ncbi:unnamed protein product [Prorocentrum cordatum]|uniref:Uncharacterized protein n=1 Tax=Prorocentrum cordatum TaxID=2364126 RepID=A0ABN9REH4_9DINO|nr:unnamed protein product [Polarella glacialis]
MTVKRGPQAMPLLLGAALQRRAPCASDWLIGVAEGKSQGVADGGGNTGKGFQYGGYKYNYNSNCKEDAEARKVTGEMQQEAEAAMEVTKDGIQEEVIVGDGQVAARVRCFLAALAALVECRAPAWLQRLRRNAAPYASMQPSPGRSWRAPTHGRSARPSAGRTSVPFRRAPPALARNGSSPIAESQAQASGQGMVAGWSLAERQGGPAGAGWAPGLWQDPQQPGLLLEAFGVELQPRLRVLVGERGASKATCMEDLGVEVAAESPTECVAALGGELEVVEAVEADVGLICSAQSAAEVDGEDFRERGPDVGAGTASEFNVEDFLAEMFAVSGGEGGVRMGGVARVHERVGVDIEPASGYMASPRFSEGFHVEGEFPFRVGAARAARGTQAGPRSVLCLSGLLRGPSLVATAPARRVRDGSGPLTSGALAVVGMLRAARASLVLPHPSSSEIQLEKPRKTLQEHVPERPFVDKDPNAIAVKLRQLVTQSMSAPGAQPEVSWNAVAAQAINQTKEAPQALADRAVEPEWACREPLTRSVFVVCDFNFGDYDDIGFFVQDGQNPMLDGPRPPSAEHIVTGAFRRLALRNTLAIGNGRRRCELPRSRCPADADMPAAIPRDVVARPRIKEIVDGYAGQVQLAHHAPPDERKYFARILQAAANDVQRELLVAEGWTNGATALIWRRLARAWWRQNWRLALLAVSQNARAREPVQVDASSKSAATFEFAEFQRGPEDIRRMQLVATSRAAARDWSLLRDRSRSSARSVAARDAGRLLEVDGRELTATTAFSAARAWIWQVLESRRAPGSALPTLDVVDAVHAVGGAPPGAPAVDRASRCWVPLLFGLFGLAAVRPCFVRPVLYRWSTAVRLILLVPCAAGMFGNDLDVSDIHLLASPGNTAELREAFRKLVDLGVVVIASSGVVFVIVALGIVVASELHGSMLGMDVKQSAICCCGMAEKTSKAYMELDEAAKSLSVASRAVTHDSGPAVMAMEKTEEAMQLIKPLTDMSPTERLDTEGPIHVDMTESVQSATRREGRPTSSQSTAELLPAALTAPQVARRRAASPVTGRRRERETFRISFV